MVRQLSSQLNKQKKTNLSVVLHVVFDNVASKCQKFFAAKWIQLRLRLQRETNKAVRCNFADSKNK